VCAVPFSKFLFLEQYAGIFFLARPGHISLDQNTRDVTKFMHSYFFHELRKMHFSNAVCSLHGGPFKVGQHKAHKGSERWS